MPNWLRLCLHAPRRALAFYVADARAIAQRKRDHPHGGCCHSCGCQTGADASECDDCWYARAW